MTPMPLRAWALSVLAVLSAADRTRGQEEDPTPATAADAATQLAGQVVDAERRPIEGARIEAYYWFTWAALEDAELIATTAADGGFGVDIELLRKRYERGGVALRLVAAGYQPAFAFLSGRTLASGELGTVVLEAGRKAQVFVRSVEGAALAGATVRVQGATSGADPRTGPRRLDAITDERGRAVVDGAPRGLLAIRIDAPGHYSQLLAAAQEPLVVEVEPSGWIEGRVVPPAGKQIDSGRLLVEWKSGNAMVRLVPALGRAIPLAADGTFRVTVQRPTPWRIVATALCDGDEYRAATPWSTGPAQDLEVRLADGPGRVLELRDAQGGPVVGAEWLAAEVPTGFPDRFVELFAGEQWEPVGPDGRIRVAGPADSGDGMPGVQVRFRARGFARRTISLEEPGAEGPQVVTLEGARTLVGRVLDPEGLPIGGALVEVEVPSAVMEDSGLARWTDAEGRFEIDGADDTATAIRVYRRGFAPQTRGLAAPPPADEGFELRLDRATTRSCVVDGLPERSMARLRLAAHADANLANPSGAFLVGADGTIPLPFGVEGLHVFAYYDVDELAVGGRYATARAVVVEDGVARIDAEPLVPHVVLGRVDLAIPYERLAIQAVTSGFRSPGLPSVPVRPDGSFTVHLSESTARIVVIDRATGVPLHVTDPLELGREGFEPLHLDLEVGRVRVTLKPENRAARSGVPGLTVYTPFANPDVFGLETANLDVSIAPPVLELYLPAGTNRFSLTSAEGLAGMWALDVVGEPVEVVVKDGSDTELVLDLAKRK